MAVVGNDWPIDLVRRLLAIMPKMSLGEGKTFVSFAPMAPPILAFQADQLVDRDAIIGVWNKTDQELEFYPAMIRKKQGQDDAYEIVLSQRFEHFAPLGVKTWTGNVAVFDFPGGITANNSNLEIHTIHSAHAFAMHMSKVAMDERDALRAQLAQLQRSFNTLQTSGAGGVGGGVASAVSPGAVVPLLRVNNNAPLSAHQAAIVAHGMMPQGLMEWYEPSTWQRALVPGQAPISAIVNEIRRNTVEASMLNPRAAQHMHAVNAAWTATVGAINAMTVAVVQRAINWSDPNDAHIVIVRNAIIELRKRCAPVGYEQLSAVMIARDVNDTVGAAIQNAALLAHARGGRGGGGNGGGRGGRGGGGNKKGRGNASGNASGGQP